MYLSFIAHDLGHETQFAFLFMHVHNRSYAKVLTRTSFIVSISLRCLIVYVWFSERPHQGDDDDDDDDDDYKNNNNDDYDENDDDNNNSNNINNSSSDDNDDDHVDDDDDNDGDNDDDDDIL